MIPELNPAAFARTIDRWLAISAGIERLNERDTRVIFERMDAISKGRATLLQKQLAFVGYQTFSSQTQFGAFLARSECLLDMLTDKEIKKHWAGLGWVQFSPDSSGMVRPRTVLLHVAARCPLSAGALRFDLDTFDAIVKSRVTSEQLNEMRHGRENGAPSH